jgi:Holliday junction resolvase RusA-like endonuclease
MVGEKLFNDSLFCELNSESPNITNIKKLVIQAFNAENNTNLDCESAVTYEEQEEVVKWLNRVHFENRNSQLLYRVRKPIMLPFISSTLSHKISSLSQFHCPICTITNNNGISIITLKISAMSKQASAPKKRKAFERAIKHRLGTLQQTDAFQRGEKLCLHIVFVLGKKNKDKDIDNMAKALLDALKGVLFSDDIDIDHLNLMKIKATEDDDYVNINIRRSTLNQHNDVIFNSMHHVWGEKSFLDIKDFME